MKVITIEQMDNGGKTTIINEEGFVIHDSNYKNSLNLVEDLRKFGFRNYEISTKEKKDNKIILTRNDGSVINLINFNHNVLKSEIDKKIYESFKQFMIEISNKKYDYIFLTGSQNRSNFEFLELPEGTKIMIDFELDENYELTELNQKMLEEFINKEFRDWFKIFFCVEEDGLLKIFCDNKNIVVDSSIIRYVKPKAVTMEEIYFNALENIEKKRGI